MLPLGVGLNSSSDPDKASSCWRKEVDCGGLSRGGGIAGPWGESGVRS